MQQKLAEIIDTIKPTKVYPSPVWSDGRSVFEVDEWVLSRFLLEQVIPLVGYSPYPLNELMLMAGAMVWSNPAYVFEWGTHVGKATRIFSETAEHFGLAAHIYSIDLPDDTPHVEHPGKQRGRLVRNRKNVTLLQGDGITVALSILSDVGKEKDVLFFLDGDHAYRSVFRELAAIVSQVPQAHILIHDTFYQSAAAQYNTGPYRAIQKILEQHPSQYERHTVDIGLPGMTLLVSKRIIRKKIQ